MLLISLHGAAGVFPAFFLILWYIGSNKGLGGIKNIVGGSFCEAKIGRGRSKVTSTSIGASTPPQLGHSDDRDPTINLLLLTHSQFSFKLLARVPITHSCLSLT